ncbi:hypothetical protein AWB78_08596 [Caballeronia calidae]|uniref:Uncharacterized protein n=1 Tax=Caballeronia calidae TaxID=1777139 RepID=A0A158EKQ9_9BURK|nr:hypothetical protein AWB78_08596 [Caballeronia calidae]
MSSRKALTGLCVYSEDTSDAAKFRVEDFFSFSWVERKMPHQKVGEAFFVRGPKLGDDALSPKLVEMSNEHLFAI